MVEVFFVHPDLNITDCTNSSCIDLRKYELRYVRAVKAYEELLQQISESKGIQRELHEGDELEGVSKGLATTTLAEDLVNTKIARVPSIPDYAIEISKLHCSDLELMLLDFYKTQAESALAELNYLKSYSVMNAKMKEVFSKAELSIQEEEEGLKLIARHTEAVKSLESKLKNLKAHQRKLEVALEPVLQSQTTPLALQNSSKRRSSSALNSIKE